MSIAIFPLLILLSLLAFFVPVVALIDILRRPESEWVSAGENRLLWALIVVFAHLIGCVLYLVMARPKLEQSGAIRI